MSVGAEIELIVAMDEVGQNQSPECNRNCHAREHPAPCPPEGYEHCGEYKIEMFFHGQRPEVTGVPVK